MSSAEYFTQSAERLPVNRNCFRTTKYFCLVTDICRCYAHVLDYRYQVHFRKGRAMRICLFGHIWTMKAQISLRIRAVWSGPSLSASRIIGYYRIYEWRAKTRMISCTCAGGSKSAYFAHVRRHGFAWHGPNHAAWPAEKSTDSTDWKVDLRRVPYNYPVSPSVRPLSVSENGHRALLFQCQISDDICRLLFYLNKLSLGKTFICKVERLNDKQRRFRWDGSMSHLDLRCLQKPIIIACGSERVKQLGIFW